MTREKPLTGPQNRAIELAMTGSLVLCRETRDKVSRNPNGARQVERGTRDIWISGEGEEVSSMVVNLLLRRGLLRVQRAHGTPEGSHGFPVGSKLEATEKAVQGRARCSFSVDGSSYELTLPDSHSRVFIREVGYGHVAEVGHTGKGNLRLILWNRGVDLGTAKMAKIGEGLGLKLVRIEEKRG